MIVDAASAPRRATPPRRPVREVALFATALAVTGLVLLTLVFAGDATYSDIALASGRPPATFRETGARLPGAPPGELVLGRREMSRAELLELHRGWLAYLLGRSGDQPSDPSGREHFTPSERAHMADVRNVFIAAQVAAGVGALLLAWLALRSWRRGTLARLVRAAALVVLAIVAAIGALAAVAFDAAFLLFHQIFFPQGNFLFEPGSNLLALYPQDYFYGVTLRIGGTFVLAALVLAALAHLSLRGRRASP
ncbi:MAG TPA: DUF1461 domain-containing protein [Candidatus Limnocylindria bacterium]|nr:DUF1461 domain-containing protein [Candidatus Limnocylindria bacterium]